MKKLILFLLTAALALGQGAPGMGGAPGIPAPREATVAEMVAGTSGVVFVSPRRMTGGGGPVTVSTLTVTNRILNADGTAALPSYTFTSDPDTGFHRSAAGEVGYSANGTRSFVFSSGGRLYGALAANQYLDMPNTGAISLLAAGTNQNITLTPSGTGGVLLNTASQGATYNRVNIGGGVSTIADTSAKLQLGRFSAGSPYGYIKLGATATQLRVTNAADGLDIFVLTNAGNLLLGGLTTDGTGVLQFPAATNAAGGITFGADTFFYRASSGVMRLSGTTNSQIEYYDGATQRGFSGISGTTAYMASVSGSLVLRSANTDALTLDSSQNATFAGATIMSTDALSGAGAVSVTKGLTKYTSTGGAQALTLANGADGQVKRIVHDVDGGSGVLTPTTKTGFSTITFTNAGDTVTMVYVATRGWMVTGSYGATVAP